MLEQAMKEVTSADAVAEIANARTALRCMAEIINNVPYGTYKDSDEPWAAKVIKTGRKEKGVGTGRNAPVGKSGKKNIYYVELTGHWKVSFVRSKKKYYVKTVKDFDEAVRIRDEWLESEKTGTII